MKVQRFQLDMHFQILTHWLEQRKCYIPPRDEVPGIGFIAYAGSTPISVGFLRLVEGGFAQIDGLTTNPEAPAQFRDRANDLIAESLISKAKSMNLKAIIASSTDKHTVLRAEKYGFALMPHTLFALNLNDFNKVERNN